MPNKNASPTKQRHVGNSKLWVGPDGNAMARVLIQLLLSPAAVGQKGVEGCGRSHKITSSETSCVYQQISVRSGITLHQFLTKAKQVVAYYRAASQALHTTTGRNSGNPPHTHSGAFTICWRRFWGRAPSPSWTQDWSHLM